MAEQKVELAKKILAPIGLGERIEVLLLSAADADKFAKSANAAVEKLSKLGENPLKRVSSEGKP